MNKRRKIDSPKTGGTEPPLGDILQVESDTSLFLNVHIQPKSSFNRIGGIHGDALKICITAPPVDGKANKAVIAFIANLLGIPKSAVTIRSGLRSRTKRLHIAGCSMTTTAEILLRSLNLVAPATSPTDK